MALILIPASAWERGLEPNEVMWHCAVHTLGLMYLAWAMISFNIYTAALLVAVFLYGHLSIRNGPHSLYAHQSYEAAFVWHVYKVVGFMLTMQGLLRIWSGLHVRHHKYTDTTNDPYSPVHGWLWSHMLWRFFKLPKINYVREASWLFAKRNKTVEELRIIRLLEWQERNSWRVGLLLAIVMPTIIASIWGDPIGGFLGSFFRLMLQYHLTWQINSVSHLVGSQPLSPDSSRDAPWWLAPITGLLSVGESTRHNRHHRWSRDFRIGNRWYDVDLGKWELYCAWGVSQVLKIAGFQPLVWNLHRYENDGTLRLLR